MRIRKLRPKPKIEYCGFHKALHPSKNDGNKTQGGGSTEKKGKKKSSDIEL